MNIRSVPEMIELRPCFLLFSLLLLVNNCFSQQQDNPYHINGNAVQENCNCYTLTKDELRQAGSVWNIYKIDLTKSFEFNFNVFLGCSDQGADGMVFVLQPISTSVGTQGEGMGYQDVSPSIGIAIDTYYNPNNNDPVYDHITIHRNGIITHNPATDLAGPEMVLPGVADIEDCQWHILSVIWDAAIQKLTAKIDHIERVSVTIDLVQEIFKGDPMVFWGFTAATGGEKNHQRFCTSLNPVISVLNETTCFPEPILFKDQSTSFGEIMAWNWDFGDGNTYQGKEPPPYIYSQPGNYDAKLTILGSNGCLSDTFHYKIVAGTKPTAAFSTGDSVLCENLPVFIQDASTVEYGTINKWNWQVNGQPVSQSNSFSVQYAPGIYELALKVATEEGCESTIHTGNFEVFQQPEITLNAAIQCLGEPSYFSATSDIAIENWLWEFSDGMKFNSAGYYRNFAEKGTYSLQFNAVSTDGCYSSTYSMIAEVPGTLANAGKDTLIAALQLLQLEASGGLYYQWQPATGLSDSEIYNPVALLTQDTKYKVVVTDDYGCASEDEIFIKVYKGPDIYVPNAFTPDNDGRNDRLEYVAPGISQLNYFRVYNRYGQLIFQTREGNKFWDGTINGRQQPPGTYVYEISVTDYNGKVHAKKGVVMLIK